MVAPPLWQQLPLHHHHPARQIKYFFIAHGILAENTILMAAFEYFILIFPHSFGWVFLF